MTKENLITILNNNLNTFSQEDANLILADYLLEKNIDINKIKLFFKTIYGDFTVQVSGIPEKCLNYSIKYFINKFGINQILQNNQTILYY